MILLTPGARRALAPPAMALLGALLLGAPGEAGAAQVYERFFGKFEGHAIMAGDEELTPRDLEVEIGPSEGGFTVEWTALLRKSDGRTKRIAFKVAFRPSGRDNIFRSAMRRNAFGHDVPLDPMKGEPYVWATIEGEVLIVYSMMITENGGDEMQAYERKLVDKRMELTYSRVRDGEVLRTLKGELTRVE